MFRPVFHLCATAINVYTVVYDQWYIVLPLPTKKLEDIPFQSRSMFLTFWCLVYMILPSPAKEFEGTPFLSRSLFLTMWCLAMQTIYFFIALLNDVFGTNAQTPKRAPFIRKIKDTLFSLAFPVAIYVSLAFWGIYYVDKELIFPDHIERLFPKWLNHVMHTTVAIFIIIELLCSYRNYPSRRTGMAIIVAFNCSYILWLFVIYSRTGVWVYPIFDHLDWVARVVFIMSSVCVAISFYLLGEKINSIVSASSKEVYTNGNFKSH